MVVYTFGRRRDTEALTNEGVTMLRAPVRLTDVASALIKLMVIADPVKPTTPEPPAESPADFPDAGQPAPRRFTREQLAALAEISSAIDCECPQHLAQLVAELTAFELYSAACAHRDEDDRALHEYLHATTAMARSGIEDALDRVVRAEGITV